MRTRSPFFFAALILTAAAAAEPFQLKTPPAPQTNRSSPQLRDSLAREGPFTIADQQYSVVFNYKVLAEKASLSTRTTKSAAKSASTLAHLEILEAHAGSVYQHDFPYTVTQQHFDEKLSASASLLPGSGGTALVIRILEQSASSPDGAPQFAKESWLVFTLVEGHLAALGGILPLGHGSDITVNDAVAAVMMKGGIAVMPIASTAEVLAFRAWTGSFYALVPVRFDWAHGQWGDGQKCYQTANGTARERGCIMSVEAKPQPRSPDGDTAYVHLFVAPDGNTDNSENVSVSPETSIEILEMQAIADWRTEPPDAQRVSCSFRNVWLRVLLNGQEGWVYGQDAFDALGLPLTSPQ